MILIFRNDMDLFRGGRFHSERVLLRYFGRIVMLCLRLFHHLNILAIVLMNEAEKKEKRGDDHNVQSGSHNSKSRSNNEASDKRQCDSAKSDQPCVTCVRKTCKMDLTYECDAREYVYAPHNGNHRTDYDEDTKDSRVYYTLQYYLD